MSTFNGRPDEFPWISIDRFDGVCARNSVLLLSHAHSDHMVGLDTLQPGGDWKLYTHAHTACLLSSNPRYVALRANVVPIEVDVPMSVAAENGGAVVTAIAAGHCPGSVMFLLESADATVLYTGDFRLSADDIQQLDRLRPFQLRQRAMTAVYFDSTFCLPNLNSIPDRRDTVGAVGDLIEAYRQLWLDTDSRASYAVLLRLVGCIGQEFIVTALHRRFGVQAHAKAQKLSRYSGIDGVVDAMTSDAHDTWLHVCASEKQACERFTAPRADRRLVIKPSMMWFTRQRTKDFIISKTSNKCRCIINGGILKIIPQCEGPHEFRAQYSSHSSLSEVRALLAACQAARLVPCVVPPNGSVDSVMKLVDDLVYVRAVAGALRSHMTLPVDGLGFGDDKLGAPVSIGRRFSKRTIAASGKHNSSTAACNKSVLAVGDASSNDSSKEKRFRDSGL